jgi:hypothetical protein
MDTMAMTNALKLAAAITGLVFTCVGSTWWIAPKFASAQLGMPLLDGIALSSQIADLGSFFLTLGLCILIGLGRGQREWLYPPILLLGFALAGRLIAWLLHGASLTPGMMAIETFVIALLIFTAFQLAKPQHRVLTS